MEVIFIQNSIIKKLDELKSTISNNINQYDIEQLNDFLAKLKEDLKLCIKIDKSILDIFKNRRYFRTIADLKEFSISKFNYQTKSTKRAEIEQELAKVSIFNSLNEEKLIKMIGKTLKQTKNRIKQQPKKKAPGSQKILIQDQTSRWLGLTKEQLLKELNDFQKYPDVKVMKQAARSILKANEKRFRLRDKIVNTIIERISEEKAIAYLGR